MRPDRRTVLTLALALAPALASCSDLFGTPHIVLRQVRIDTASTPPVVPSTVGQGVPFAVEIPVWTGTCSEKGPVDIEPQGTGILVTPYRRHEYRRNVVCPGVAVLETYAVELEWEREIDFEVLISAYDDWTGTLSIFRYAVVVE